MTDPHVLKVFVRHMIHELESEIDDEDQLERFKMFFLGNVDETVVLEIENWFGKENVTKLKVKLGVVDDIIEMAATPSEHGDDEENENMVSQDLKLDLTEVPPEFMDDGSPPVIKSQSLEVGNSDSSMISENSKSQESNKKSDDPSSEDQELETTAHEISIQTSFKEIDLTDESSSQGSEIQESDNPESDNPESDNPESDNPESDNPESDNPASDNPASDNPESEAIASQVKSKNLLKSLNKNSLISDDSQDPTFEVESSQEISLNNSVRRSARKKIANSSKVKHTTRTTPRKLIKSPIRIKRTEKISFSSSDSEEDDKQTDQINKNSLPEVFQKPVDTSDKENEAEHEAENENGRLTPTESQDTDKNCGNHLQVPKFNAEQVTGGIVTSLKSCFNGHLFIFHKLQHAIFSPFAAV